MPSVVKLLAASTRKRLLFVLDGGDAIADAKAVVQHQIRQGARRFIRDDLEMIRLTAHDAAQRNKAVIMLCGEFDRAGNLQRARHFNTLARDARDFERLMRAVIKRSEERRVGKECRSR